MTEPTVPAPPLAERPQAPSRPGPAPNVAFVTLYRTFLRSVRTPGRIVCLVALVGLSFAAAAITNSSWDGSPIEGGLGHAAMVASQLVAFGALVVASAALGDLYDNGSIVYLVLRPVPRWVVAAAAWAASATFVAPAALVAGLSTALVHSGDGLVGASVAAAVLGALAYCALFTLLGVLVRRALPAGLAFLVLWEGFVAAVGTAGAALTITGYLRSLLVQVTGWEISGAPFSMVTAVAMPVVITAAGVAATGWLLGRRELP